MLLLDPIRRGGASNKFFEFSFVVADASKFFLGKILIYIPSILESNCYDVIPHGKGMGKTGLNNGGAANTSVECLPFGMNMFDFTLS